MNEGSEPSLTPTLALCGELAGALGPGLRAELEAVDLVHRSDRPSAGHPAVSIVTGELGDPALRNRVAAAGGAVVAIARVAVAEVPDKRPPDGWRAPARALIDAGARAVQVVGVRHALGVEWIGDAPVLWGCGRVPSGGLGLVARLSMTPGRPDLRLLIVRDGGGVIDVCDDALTRAWLRRLLLRCARGQGFDDVDGSDDPGRFVAYLDALATLPAIRRYKAHAIARLGLRPGESVLDVGCGVGIDLPALRASVGPEGRVVGLDPSARLLAAARARGVEAELIVGRADALPFEDGSFDAVRFDRVLTHVGDPDLALAEAARVLAPGGRVHASEPDWDTFTLAASDVEATRRVLREQADAYPTPWIGRQLAERFRAAGLADVEVEQDTLALTDLATADGVFHLIDRAAVLPAATRDAWRADLDARDRAGDSLCTITGFGALGRRPAASEPALDEWLTREAQIAFEDLRTAVARIAAGPAQAERLVRALDRARASVLERHTGPGRLPLLTYRAAGGRDAVRLAAMIGMACWAGAELLDDAADGDLDEEWRRADRSELTFAAFGLSTVIPQALASDAPLDDETRRLLHSMLARESLATLAGQRLDLTQRGTLPAPDDVERAAVGKNGAPHALFAGLGALLAGARGPRLDAFVEYGRALGVLRQLSSDMSEVIFSDDARDLRQRNRPLLVAMALESAEDPAALAALLDRAAEDDEALAEARRRLKKGGPMIAFLRRMERWAEAARAALADAAPDYPAAASLAALIEERAPSCVGRG